MNGIHEVRGSIPLVSTNLFDSLRQILCLPFLLRCRHVTRFADSQPLHRSQVN